MKKMNRVWADIRSASLIGCPIDDCRSQATKDSYVQRTVTTSVLHKFSRQAPAPSFCISYDMPNTAPGAQNGSFKKASVDTMSIPSHPFLSPNVLINHNNIFLFIPNLIGYTRIILAASSLYYMRWHPKYCTWLYIVSCLLDAFDGMAARRFGQSITHLPPPNCWMRSLMVWRCS